MTLPSVSGLEALSDDWLARWTRAFERHSFDSRTFDAIDRIAPLALYEARIPVVRWHLERRREAPIRLALLFNFGGSLPREEVEALLGAELTGRLLDAGILKLSETGITSRFRIEPFFGLWIVADGSVGEPESVMPPGPTTEQLGEILPEAIAGSVFEVACGPGGVALLAARRGARRVLGTDLSERAIAIARFNARLNRLEAEFRVGDLTAPAAGERFDLVVAQPPYLFHPPDTPEILFMHGGERGDTLTLRLIRELPAVIAPGGEALVLSDVSLLAGEELESYVAARLGQVPLRVLLLHAVGPEPDVQAMSYASYQTGGGLGPRYLALARAYLTHLEKIGITRVRQALFVARPVSDSDAASIAMVAVRNPRGATPVVRERLWAATECARAADRALTAQRIRVAPDAEWVSRRTRPEGEQSEHRVRFGERWPALEQIVTDEGLVLASLLENSPDLEAAVRGYAERCDATPDEVRAPVLEYIRAGLMTGMLVMEDDHGG
ncbi:MAG TPA: methyltransferase domain-containing protein [Candidatus Sulfotelmatobacter sp.]|nr:methyltransferase domain-containing protein [Candidatus Sulfotelmatobacter sp.]